MADITKMPMGELLEDKDFCYGDLLLCEALVKLGRTEVKGMSVPDRLTKNKQIIEIIDNEIKRRETL